MNAINKKELSALLSEAISREELRTGEAARFLNLNPCYLAMMQNEKHWDSAGKAPWDRLILWKEQRCKISEFEIPEGETIYIPKPKIEKTVTDTIIKSEVKTDPLIIPKFKEKPKASERENRDKPPKFNYDFLKDKKFINIKEKEAEFMDFIGSIIEKKLLEFNIPMTLEKTADVNHLKVALDIEINLILNGQKVRLN
jgi:hypothetical protein